MAFNEFSNRSLDAKVYEMAEHLGVSQKQTKEIVRVYIEVCREELASGGILRIFGLIDIIPDRVSHESVYTTAMYAKKVAEILSLPYYTVRETIRAFITCCENDLFSGRSVCLQKVATIIPIINENKEVIKFRSVRSSFIFEGIDTNASAVTSVRAHLSNLLKRKIRASIRA